MNFFHFLISSKPGNHKLTQKKLQRKLQPFEFFTELLRNPYLNSKNYLSRDLKLPYKNTIENIT